MDDNKNFKSKSRRAKFPFFKIALPQPADGDVHGFVLMVLISLLKSTAHQKRHKLYSNIFRI